jgi:hypothetical protein
MTANPLSARNGDLCAITHRKNDLASMVAR